MSQFTHDTDNSAPKRHQHHEPVLEYTSNDEVAVISVNGCKYRRSVCVIIMNDKGLFLGCRRCDNKRVLQFVQGGARRHESPQQTAERELFEEIGLPATYLRYAGEILPVTSGDEVRAAFRYTSKSWWKRGFTGQELYPLLYLAETEVIDKLHFRAIPGVRQEFCGAMWMKLEEFVRYCQPCKATAVSNICTAVVSFAHLGFTNAAGSSLSEVDAPQGENVRDKETTPIKKRHWQRLQTQQ
ncbi:NUDIX hydrolase [Trypanosoma rangeli]|uniref:NUDIX hydrolase n=1 Tax=Trypanosoma rangeli TaxID=5698 RepID=A0A422P4Y4_TRYRA|nr:NUDIX hydrolase [Trypanosoma rangeli]RNF12780.1 NUDIX hydrolase [Trypanosoma rangeli]|eukprot:RNF12780.1 NUDIX hydrolase [Trypanosoma rangeli]